MYYCIYNHEMDGILARAVSMGWYTDYASGIPEDISVACLAEENVDMVVEKIKNLDSKKFEGDEIYRLVLDHLRKHDGLWLYPLELDDTKSSVIRINWGAGMFLTKKKPYLVVRGANEV